METILYGLIGLVLLIIVIKILNSQLRNYNKWNSGIESCYI